MLGSSNAFGDLVELWLTELESRDISEGTKDNYRDDLRVHVRPFFDDYTLGEITTGWLRTSSSSKRPRGPGGRMRAATDAGPHGKPHAEPVTPPRSC